MFNQLDKHKMNNMIANNRKCQKGKKGQVAFEFLIIYSMFMIAFIAIVYASSQRAIYQQMFAEQTYAREIGMRFAQEINTAARFPGYYKNYVFSETIKGSKFNLTISTGALILLYKDTGVFYYPLMTKDITLNGLDTSTGIKASINTSIGYMLVKNINGRVILEQR